VLGWCQALECLRLCQRSWSEANWEGAVARLVVKVTRHLLIRRKLGGY